MGGDIRKKGKVESAMEFVERMKRVQGEAEAVLKKAQEDMKDKQTEEGKRLRNEERKTE